MKNFDINFYKKRLKKMYMTLGIILACTNLPSTFKTLSNLEIKLENYEKLNTKDDILDDVINVYKKDNIALKDNVAFACGWFSKVLESGSISVNNIYEYDNNKVLENYLDNDDYNCILGTGVCRNENLLISNLLNLAGFDTVPLCSSLNENDETNHLYILIYDHDIDKKYIFDYTNKGFWEIDNLDSISYIYNTNIVSKASIDFTYRTYSNFTLNDLVKINTYENSQNFDDIIRNYIIGMNSFTNDDYLEICNLTKEKKEKIKVLEYGTK